MRVPDISATAGYAASVYNPINNQRENNHSTNSLLLTALGTGHKTLDNTPITATSNYYRDSTPSTLATSSTAAASTTSATLTNYASAADEFIQKALNSTPTEYSPPILNHLNDNNLPHYCCGALPKALLNSFEDCYDKDVNNTGNTYKSFKEIFNTNKSFYEDCVRDFENINLLKNAEDDHVNDTDLDPIELINSQETPNSNNECLQHICMTTNPFDAAFSQYNAANCNTIQSIELEAIDDKSDDLIDTEKIESGFEPDDNDYDDQSMIDLCSDTKSIYDSDEKEDDFLTSTSSSSGSLHTPKHSFFPRGIINPNYPGFQHLAHTLSEHFINSSPSDSYESDMSEYEMELSADSFESLNGEKSQLQLNTYNNNTPEKIMNPSEHHNNLEYLQKTRTDNDNDNDDDDENDICLMECNKAHRPSLNEDDDSNRNSHINNRSFNMADLQDHLKNTLTLLERQEQKNMPPISITPDILIKNYNLHVQPLNKKENRPDLLRGVSPHLVPEKRYAEIKHANFKSAKPLNVNCYGMRNTEVKDEMSYGLTPVDIIGDFGQEVEREFGLLVSGYRRLVDTQDVTSLPMDEGDKISDAALSVAKDQIDTNKYLEALNKQTDKNEEIDKISPELADDNAVDLPLTTETPQKPVDKTLQTNTNPPAANIKTETRLKPKYQKSSYDDRQLPPVAIEYKRCQQALRSTKKLQSNHNEKSTKVVKNNHTKPSIASRLFHSKRNSSKADSSSNRKREEAELNQYQQLISDKEQILSNSKYAKLSSWAQYLKNSVNERGKRGSTDLISPSALELFDAYKIGTEIDMEQLQQHLKMAKEIEKKRRSDREEIRRRLAMGAEENSNEPPQQQTQQQSERNLWKPSIQSRLQNDFIRITELSSDTESHSSDSETCPKLSKSKSQIGMFPFNGGQLPATATATATAATDNQQMHPYHGRPLSVSISTSSNINNNNSATTLTQQHHQQLQQQLSETFSNEDRECDFFTKQAKLQIEARMALSQAKEMAHMQMEIERQNQRVSPITAIIRHSLDKVGVQIKPDKRRLSRQLLTDMNIAQLQILVNNLHTHIEDLNESLVNYLMERDDLHDSQDTMLVDIEELTRFIGAKEHIAQQERISSVNKCSK